VTSDELGRLIEQYRAGLEAEFSLLQSLGEIAQRQNTASHAADFAGLERIADERDQLMRSLVMIEEGLRDVRRMLAEHRGMAETLRGYNAVAALHRRASHLVNRILSTDKQSLAALADAELARRSAIASVERSENTLAAYRRVLAPPVSPATLVDRRG
jgi:hypothetical protein